MKKFYLLLILTAILFIFNLFRIANSNNRIYAIFPPVYTQMNFIVDIHPDYIKAKDDVILKVNDEYYAIPPSKNILNKNLSGKINNLELLINADIQDKVKGVVVFNEIKTFYFSNLNVFSHEKKRICMAEPCKIYSIYKINPELIKYNKNSKTINFSTVQNALCNFYVGSIIFLILIFAFTKINPYILTGLGFLLSILMFSNGVFDYLPWYDEYRTIEYSDPKMPISELFSDPGNPPLFYFLFRLFISIFGINLYSMRIFPLIIAILALFTLWYFLKSRFDIKTANIGLFIASINLPFVYYATETRCYILQILLTPVFSYLLFKIFDNNDKKYYILYGVLTALAVNIHYYEILFLISNFIFASCYFIYKKRYNDILKFFTANFIGGIFFLPFFIKTAMVKALGDSSFNNWIPDINFFQIKKCVYYVFGGFISLVLSIIFFIRAFFKKQIIILYSFSIIVLTIIQGVILSYLIRPMLVERYLISLIPLFIIFLSIIFTLYKKRAFIILFIIWIFFIQTNSFEKNNRRKGLLEIPMSFSKQYFEQTKNKNVYAVIKDFSNPEYLQNKDDYMINDITYLKKPVYDIEKTIKDVLDKNKNAVIFTNLLMPDEKNFNLPDNYTCYFNSSVDMCLWKITK